MIKLLCSQRVITELNEFMLSMLANKWIGLYEYVMGRSVHRVIIFRHNE